jgi:hypothetical protein
MTEHGQETRYLLIGNKSFSWLFVVCIMLSKEEIIRADARGVL